MKKKIISLLLMASMTAAILTGCGGGDNPGGSENPSRSENSDGSQTAGTEAGASAQGDDLTQNRTITAWLYPDDYKYYSSYDENPVVQYLNNKFNCTLKFQQPPMGSEQDQFNLMLGTGEYTDVFEVTYSQDSTSTLFADGVIRDLAPYAETYMPNYYAFLNDPDNEDIRKALYDEEGHLLTISSLACDESSLMWGGMVYRKDILETMTGGNVAFPSGEAEPTTVEDWEYMLDLMKQYFDAAQMPEYAGLILPYQGYFATGEILNGFGTSGAFMVKDGQVVYGPTSQEFYNYLVKMREWYEKGWIYQDFASRTNDLFYLPNTALTYGCSAGIWFGMSNQVNDQMSLPEYNLFVDVQPVASPLDTENGQNGSNSGTLGLASERANPNQGGWAVSASCSEENMIRFMTIADYMYSEEGAMLVSYGFSADMGAAEIPLYQEKGVTEGTYYFDEEGTFHKNDLFVTGATEETLDLNSFNGMRLPGLHLNSYANHAAPEHEQYCDSVWKKYGTANNFPAAAGGTPEESAVLTSKYTGYSDYLNSMVPKFIMGTEELNEETFAAFVEQMNDLGVEECRQIYQDIYDRYNSR